MEHVILYRSASVKYIIHDRSSDVEVLFELDNE